MTQLLDEVIHKIEKLPNQEQDIIATLILDEINWQDTLANTQNELAFLAFEALEEYKSNKTQILKL